MKFPFGILFLTALAMATLWLGVSNATEAIPRISNPELVIIDTDIGSDIDDAFAIALAIKSPEIKLLGITTASGDTLARARIVDRLLGESGFGDIPVAIGALKPWPFESPPFGRQFRYGESEQFRKSGHLKAEDFIRDKIRQFPGKITLIAIGPLTNLGELIEKDPQEFKQLKRVVLMGGAIGPEYGGFGSTMAPTPEYNIKGDIPAAQKVFESGVPLYLFPLDSTAQLKLDEVKRDEIFGKGTPLAESLGVLYLLWGKTTPILYDAMAIAYPLDPSLCPVQSIHILLDDKGIMGVTPGQPNVQVCLHSEPEKFFRFFMARMN